MNPRQPASRALAHAIATASVLTLSACGEAPLPEQGGQEADSAAYRMNIPVVDQGHAGQLTGAAPTATAPSAQATTASTPTTSGQQASGAAQQAAAGSCPNVGTEQERDTVRTYIRRLMDETRIVPDTAAKKGGPRGSPGSFAKLSGAEVEEFVSAIIYGAKHFLPQSLRDEERWALVCAEISIESAFTPGTSGVNPGDNSKRSVGPLQLTLPGMWDDIFRKKANIPDLVHYDGSPWRPSDTSNERLEHSIWDAVVASLWCITAQGRAGCPEYIGGPDGPCPKTMHTAFLAWVIGGPEVRSGGDLAGQRDAYIASISTDLKLLGFDAALVDAAF